MEFKHVVIWSPFKDCLTLNNSIFLGRINKKLILINFN